YVLDVDELVKGRAVLDRQQLGGGDGDRVDDHLASNSRAERPQIEWHPPRGRDEREVGQLGEARREPPAKVREAPERKTTRAEPPGQPLAGNGHAEGGEPRRHECRQRPGNGASDAVALAAREIVVGE